VLSGSSWVAVAIVAAATVAGAALAAPVQRFRSAALRLAAAALFAVVGLDLVPDLFHDVAETGSAWWLVGSACAVAFTGAVAAAGSLCRCGSRARTTTGLAIAVHRSLEGAALALAGSAAVVCALVLHAAAEGFALRAYGARCAGRVRPVLWLACAAPAAGALALGRVELPGAAAPMITALVAGVLVAGAGSLIRPACSARGPSAGLADQSVGIEALSARPLRRWAVPSRRRQSSTATRDRHFVTT
jgi:ZIP family zinc transporter